MELPAILAELSRQKMILPGAGGYESLALTGQGVLESTSRLN